MSLGFPSGHVSLIHQLRLWPLQHLPSDLRMPANSIFHNSVSRTQTCSEKAKTGQGACGLFEETGSAYVEQQDFGAHNACSELEDYQSPTFGNNFVG